MKRVILTILSLLIGLSSYAQTAAAKANCRMLIKHEATAPSCINGMDGAVVLKISGAKRPFTVQWSDGGTGESRAAIPAGLYIATVTDAAGCVTRYDVQLAQGKQLTGNLNVASQKTGSAARLLITFANGSKPAAIQIKNLSEGVRSNWRSYQGETLTTGIYLVEAFTRAGCSQTGKIDLRAQ